MRRLAAILVILPFFFGPIPPAGAEGTTIVWQGERIINGTVELDKDLALEIVAGANIAFEPPAILPEDLEDNSPALVVNGTLEINGLGTDPVSFAGNQSIEPLFDFPPCIFVNGTAGPGAFSVQNATFRDMYVAFENASGTFSDCAFISSLVYTMSTCITFRNCSFNATVIHGKQDDPNATTIISGCSFNGSAANAPKWFGGGFSRFAVFTGGTVKMDNTTITYFLSPITCYPVNFTMVDSRVDNCASGIGLSRPGRPERMPSAILRNVTMDGGSMGVYTDIDSIIEDCLFKNANMSALRLFPQRLRWDSVNGTAQTVANISLLRNRFEGNRLAIELYGPDIDISTNVFVAGNLTSGSGGIMEKYLRYVARVLDNAGRFIDEPAMANRDSSGLERNGTYSSSGDYHSVTLLDYTVDSAGIRTDHYPYTIYAEKDNIRSETQTITKDTLNLTLVVPLFNDLVPFGLASEQRHPVAGQMVSFSAEAQNRGVGNSTGVLVALYIDGVRFGDVNITFIGPDQVQYPVFDGWNATVGRHTIELCLDPDNRVLEYNETNNNLTFVLVVSDPPPPDLSWTYFQLGVGSSAGLIIIAMFLRIRRRPPQ